MNTAGKLDETPLRDLLSQLTAEASTGTLHLIRGALRARIGFRDGLPVSARAPGLQRLGELLVTGGYADPIKVRTAARIQAEEKGRRPIGQILVSTGVISSEQLAMVVGEQIQQTLVALSSWSTGQYRFEPGEVPAFDEVRTEDSSTPVLAKTRPQSQPGDSTRPPSPARPSDRGTRGRARTGGSTRSGSGGDANAVSLRTSDVYFAERIHEAALAADLELRWRHQRSADDETSTAAAIQIIDLRHGEGTTRELTALRRRIPQATLVAIIDRGAASDPVYAAGAVSVLPPDPRTIAFGLKHLLQALSTAASKAVPVAASGGSVTRASREAAPAPVQPPAARTIASERDSANVSATAALDLMQAIAQQAERAILFLIRRKDLLVAGAFGTSDGNRPLAELSRGLRVALKDAGKLQACIEAGSALVLPRPAESLPASLRDWVGQPAAGSGVVLPISGGALPIGLIYADNGALPDPIGDLVALADAAARFGPSLETEILIGEAARTLI